METTTIFNVTKETAAYIKALKAVEQAENDYLEALSLHMGETSGDERFYKVAAGLFEQIKDEIGKDMALCISYRQLAPNTI